MTLIPDSTPRPNTFEVHGPQSSHQEGSSLPAGAPGPSTGTLLARSFLLGGVGGALIGLSTGVIAMGSSILDPEMGADFGGQRWVGFITWLAIGGLIGAVLGAIAGVVAGPLLVLLRIHRLVSVISGILAIGAVLLARRIVFGFAWMDHGNAQLLGDVVAAGLAGVAAYLLGRVALKLLTPKAA